jgi:hypothetical protein
VDKLNLQRRKPATLKIVVCKPGCQSVTFNQTIVSTLQFSKSTHQNVNVRAGKIRTNFPKCNLFPSQFGTEIESEFVAAPLEFRVAEISGVESCEAATQTRDSDGEEFAQRGEVIEPLPSGQNNPANIFRNQIFLLVQQFQPP